MLIFGTILYAALTIIFVPILMVLIYISIINNRYDDVFNVYNIESSTIIGFISFMIIIYLFLTGFCIGDLPIIWRSTIFIMCFIGSIFLSFSICKILKFFNRDRIKYANILLADKQICDKINVGKKQLSDLKSIMNMNSYTQELRERNKEQLSDIQEMLNKLVIIHQELQQQKILMNTSMSSTEMKNVVLKDSKTVHKILDLETDKFESHRIISDNYRSVRKLMKKYNV